jgi:hypothetical protein
MKANQHADDPIRSSCNLSTDSPAGRFLIPFAWALLLPMTAPACTLCDSENGRLVRAEIFSDAFWPTLLTVISPFPVLLILLAAIYFGLRRPSIRSWFEKQT